MRRTKDNSQFTLRLPPELLEQIRERASVLNRSISAEIQTLIEQALVGERASDAKVIASLSRHDS